MTQLHGKRYWVVGASEGLGRAVTKRLATEGVRMALSARSEDRLKSLAASLPVAASVHTLDVTELASVKAAAQSVGPVDGVIVLTGVYWPMCAATFDAQQVERMCDVNFTGTARVLSTVVPGFVARDAGHIVLTGSLSGFRGLPGAIGYGAAKAGMMHLAENLQAELVNTGVKVQLINPGFIKTRLTDKNSFNMPFLMTPEEAAGQFVAAMQSGRFQTNFPRLFSWIFRLSNFLPAGAYYRLAGTRAQRKPAARRFTSVKRSADTS
ncbi:MAG: SDR family NAD(P)-dependent oxidoreductase [Rhodobacteraceae bacterium]|nr:SDR family NAD(P)-dependent oxidoreductase [Paracoccaceae bacterium]